jgi:hypothetical protein
LPTSLAARIAEDLPEFPEGAIEARWEEHARGRNYSLRFDDLVTLARYALV